VLALPGRPVEPQARFDLRVTSTLCRLIDVRVQFGPQIGGQCFNAGRVIASVVERKEPRQIGDITRRSRLLEATRATAFARIDNREWPQMDDRHDRVRYSGLYFSRVCLRLLQYRVFVRNISFFAACRTRLISLVRSGVFLVFAVFIPLIVSEGRSELEGSGRIAVRQTRQESPLNMGVRIGFTDDRTVATSIRAKACQVDSCRGSCASSIPPLQTYHLVYRVYYQWIVDVNIQTNDAVRFPGRRTMNVEKTSKEAICRDSVYVI